MATPTFYYPELSERDDTINLSSRESVHAYKARRLRAGSAIQLINGQGLSADGQIESTEGDQLVVLVSKCRQHVAPVRRCRIAAAIPKGDRQRFMVEMLTQLGVAEIIPLQCEHSVTVYKQPMYEKWQRYAIEACKQSQNPWLPQIHEGCTLESILNQKASARDPIMYADANGGDFDRFLHAGNDVTLFIGPEGGFSQTEIDAFEQAKANAVQLGKHILRTEAAAIVAATLLVLG